MENAKKFFEEIIKTEEAKVLFSSFEKPETEEETYKIYVEIAKKLGAELSEDEIKAYFDGKTVFGEIDDEELSQLTGGKDHADCKDTFQDYENCWWDDACDLVNSRYSDYNCKRNLKGKTDNIKKACEIIDSI